MSLWLSRDNSRNEIYDLRFLHLLVSRDIHLELGSRFNPFRKRVGFTGFYPNSL